MKNSLIPSGRNRAFVLVKSWFKFVTSASAEVTHFNLPRSGSTEWSATGVAPTGAGL